MRPGSSVVMNEFLGLTVTVETSGTAAGGGCCDRPQLVRTRLPNRAMRTRLHFSGSLKVYRLHQRPRANYQSFDGMRRVSQMGVRILRYLPRTGPTSFVLRRSCVRGVTQVFRGNRENPAEICP